MALIIRLADEVRRGLKLLCERVDDFCTALPMQLDRDQETGIELQHANDYAKLSGFFYYAA